MRRGTLFSFLSRYATRVFVIATLFFVSRAVRAEERAPEGIRPRLALETVVGVRHIRMNNEGLPIASQERTMGLGDRDEGGLHFAARGLVAARFAAGGLVVSFSRTPAIDSLYVGPVVRFELSDLPFGSSAFALVDAGYVRFVRFDDRSLRDDPAGVGTGATVGFRVPIGSHFRFGPEVGADAFIVEHSEFAKFLHRIYNGGWGLHAALTLEVR